MKTNRKPKTLEMGLTLVEDDARPDTVHNCVCMLLSSRLARSFDVDGREANTNTPNEAMTCSFT
jgi:hypothetical protein